jgi:hypothetical protein
MITANERSPSHATISGGPLRSTSSAPPSTAHHRANATGFDQERAHQPSANVPGCPCIARGIEHGESPFHITPTRTYLMGLERANYQPHAAMFGGAQSATSHGGVFLIVQGGASHISPAEAHVR